MKQIILTVIVMGLVGCASTPKTPSAVFTSGNVQRLTSRPDTDAAISAAPEWVKDSLITVNHLEAELKEAKVK